MPTREDWRAKNTLLGQTDSYVLERDDSGAVTSYTWANGGDPTTAAELTDHRRVHLENIEGATEPTLPDFPGLGLWLDGADNSALWQDAAATIQAGGGDPIGAWSDKSGAGIVSKATQSTASDRPTRGPKGCAFDGPTGQWLDLGDNFDIGTGGLTAIVVGKFADNSHNGSNSTRFIQKRGSGGFGTQSGWQWSRGYWSDGWSNTGVDDGNGNSVESSGALNMDIFTGPDPPEPRWGSMVYNEANGTLRLKSTANEKINTNINLVGKSIATPRHCTIGCSWDNASTQSQFLDGEIFEVLLYMRALSDAEHDQIVDDYLTPKWGKFYL